MARILNVARPKKFIDLQCSVGGGGDCVLGRVKRILPWLGVLLLCCTSYIQFDQYIPQGLSRWHLLVWTMDTTI